MRLKTSMDGALSMRNGNHNVLNSPKRLNTLQNSNVTAHARHAGDAPLSNNPTEHLVDNNATAALDAQTLVLNNINCGAGVQWCTGELTTNQQRHHQPHPQQPQQFQQQQQRPLNINNGTLAAPLRRAGSAESSPDDSLLEYEEARSASSADASPQDEERAFELSDSDDSDDGNNLLAAACARRGIVNPNYPGFQHLAHTLEVDLGLDVDDSEDEYAERADPNANADSYEHGESCNNNNNNNEPGREQAQQPQNDKIDSVNRLDSVENIQKVFYDKPVFNITCESAGSAVKASLSCGTLGRIAGDHLPPPLPPPPAHYRVERATQRELEKACEKLAVVDLQPAATKYNIEPNVEQPFVLEAAAIAARPILQDAVIVRSAAAHAAHGEMLLIKAKLSDALLSGAEDKLPACARMEVERQPATDGADLDSNRAQSLTPAKMADAREEPEKFCKEDQTKDEQEKDEDSAVPRKKERTEDAKYAKKRRDCNQQIGSLISIPRREFAGRGRDNLNRRSLPLSSTRNRKKASPELLGGFDVYNIETAMPKIDLEVIESHLRAAREEERRRRTDREEIRRRLAMGNEDDYYNGCDRPGRKPSLQARLQSGMNLQICFMNETASDTESPSSDSECTLGKPKQAKTTMKAKPEKKSLPPVRPATLSIGHPQPLSLPATMNETDFFAKQARLQTEARMALAQAKEMARMQMEIERQRQKKSPITEMVRHSMEKVGIPFPEDRRRLSRQILTEMNVAQLQVIVNDLHTQIEILNESLVKFLMARDDLHMEQDSMLVDIEDLTRFLGAKEQIIKEHSLTMPSNNNASPPPPAPSSPLSTINSSVKPHFNRIASLVKK